MKKEFVLRPVESASGEIRFSLRSPDQVQLRGGEPSTLTVLRQEENGYVAVLLGDRVAYGFLESKDGVATFTLDGRTESFSLSPAALDAMRQNLMLAKAHGGPMEMKSPIPGLIRSVLVEVNAAVTAGQTLAILEAMKMENEIRAPHAGIVEKVNVAPGQNVAAGALLFTLKSS